MSNTTESLSVREAAAYLNLDHSRVLKFILAGRLPATWHELPLQRGRRAVPPDSTHHPRRGGAGYYEIHQDDLEAFARIPRPTGVRHT